MTRPTSWAASVPTIAAIDPSRSTKPTFFAPSAFAGRSTDCARGGSCP
ncbi:hypothetical protein [Lysobacter gummosus]